jgi:hypothetical protein
MRKLLCILLLLLVSVPSTVHAAEKNPPSQRLLSLCANQPPISKQSNKRRYKQLRWLRQASGDASLMLASSPQHAAACWMLYEDQRARKLNSQTAFLQRYALATLYFATATTTPTASASSFASASSSSDGKTKKPHWDWSMANDVPLAVQQRKGDWLSRTTHECQWYGVQCNVRQTTVVGISLGFLALEGMLPRELGLLTQLIEFDVHGCDLQGVVPHKLLAGWPKLEYLRLHMNGFFGAIHREINELKSLKQLIIFGNYFGGSIPPTLAELKNLEIIDLYANQLSGTIPTELGRLKNLKSLDLHDNNLIGRMPKEICDLKLKELVADCLGPNPEVLCDCCTKCCKGLPEMRCVDVATGKASAK